jgi:hypothetical protein
VLPLALTSPLPSTNTMPSSTLPAPFILYLSHGAFGV